MSKSVGSVTSLFDRADRPESMEEWLTRRASLVRSCTKYDLYVAPIFGLDDALLFSRNMHDRQRDARRGGYRFIAKHAEEILTGHFFDETMMFYLSRGSFRVIDGQHRVLGLIRACEKNPDTVWRDVLVRVVDERSVAGMDRGRSRLAHENAVFVLNEKVPRAVMKALVLVKFGMPGDANTIITDSATTEAAMECPFLPEITSLHNRTKLKSIGFLAGYSICKSASPDRADVFFNAIARDEVIVDGQPSTSAQALGQALRKIAKGRAYPLKVQREIAARCVQAFNAWASGKEITMSRYQGEVPAAVEG